MLIHTKPFENNFWLNSGVGMITRFAVPYFFAISVSNFLFVIFREKVICKPNNLSDVLPGFIVKSAELLYNSEGNGCFMNEEVYQMDNNTNNDAVAARRRALAEALRTGEPVVVTASGEVEKKDDAQEQGMSGIQVPDGKLA